MFSEIEWFLNLKRFVTIKPTPILPILIMQWLA